MPQFERGSLLGSRAIVVGAGAWGLPSALALQDRGWRVTLLERFESGGPLASSGGSTRLWRLADTQPWRARALLDTVAAMDRLGDRIGEAVFRQTGLLWRDDRSLPAVAGALDSIAEHYERVAADRVADYFTGLRPDGRDAIYVERAGVVYADRLLSGALQAFVEAGGDYRPHTRAVRVEPGPVSASVFIEGGEILTADQVLVAAGPGIAELLPGIGISLPVKPYLEQVVYLGDPQATPPVTDLPSLIDCPLGETPGIYSMPNGELGYKVGLDHPLRALQDETLGEDLDRVEDPERTEVIRARVERDLSAVVPHVLATQVCTWTDSGDADFVVGRVHPTVVLACGDSGEGFKFAAFMGEYLSALIEGGGADPEFQEYWNPHRFGMNTTPRAHFDAIGRH